MKMHKTLQLALSATLLLGLAGPGCAKQPPPAAAGAATGATADQPASAAAPVAASAPAKEPFGRFSMDELEAKMQAAKAGTLKLFVYDNNSIERYKKGHLPGAKWVNYEAITQNDLPKDKDATLVFYCANEH